MVFARGELPSSENFRQFAHNLNYSSCNAIGLDVL